MSKKSKTLPTVSPERLAIFDQFNLAPEVRDSLHRQLCTATPEQRQQWAETHNIPVDHANLHAWENRILFTSQTNIKRFFDVMDRMLGQIHSGLDYCKGISMGLSHAEVSHLLEK